MGTFLLKAFALHCLYVKRELKHRWVTKLEHLFGWELSKKHFSPVRI
jgi:hypothetical protein